MESFEDPSLSVTNNVFTLNTLALTDFTLTSTGSFGVYDTPPGPGGGDGGHATDDSNFIYCTDQTNSHTMTFTFSSTMH